MVQVFYVTCRKPILDSSKISEDLFLLGNEFRPTLYTVKENLKNALEDTNLKGISFKKHDTN